MLREQFFAIRSKRRKLGEQPGEGKARTPRFPPAWHWEHWGPGSLHGDGVGAVTAQPGALEPPKSPALGWELCSPLTWAHPPHRAAAPSIALAEEPGLPPGHAGPPGADGEWPWAPREAGGCPRAPHCPHSLPAPPRASLCSLSASTSWSCCWMMPRCHGACRYPGEGMGQRRVLSLADHPSSTCSLLYLQDASLGQVSFSIFGSFGAALQVVLILYPSGGHSCPQ